MQSHKDRTTHDAFLTAFQGRRIGGDDSFYKVKCAVESGDIIIDVVLAPPRTGSTASALHISQELGYDGLLIEPEAWFGEKEPRIIVLCQQIEMMLDQLKKDYPHPGTYRILLKIMTNQFGTMSDIQSMMNLVNKTMLLVRNPVRSFESALLYKSRLVQAFGNGPTTVSGLRDSCLVSADTDLSHISDAHPEGKSAWEQHIDYMRLMRDYTSLTSVVLDSTHKLDKQTAFQQEVFSWLAWHSSARMDAPPLYDKTYLAYLEEPPLRAGIPYAYHGPERHWERLVNQALDQWESAGGNSVDIKHMPTALQSLFTGWHLGWNMLSGFQWGMATRHQDVEPDKWEPPFLILDFDTFIEDPSRVLTELSRYFSIPLRKNMSMPLVINRYHSDIHGQKLASVAFAQAASDRIPRPPSQPVLPIDRFPPFILVHLKNALSNYVELTGIQKLQEHKDAAPKFSRRESLLSVFQEQVDSLDPVRRYVALYAKDMIACYRIIITLEKLFTLEGHPIKQYGEMARAIPTILTGHWNRRQLAKIKSRNPAFLDYFKALDNAMCDPT